MGAQCGYGVSRMAIAGTYFQAFWTPDDRRHTPTVKAGRCLDGVPGAELSFELIPPRGGVKPNYWR